MSSLLGVVAQGVYTAPSDKDKVTALLNLIPNPDAPHGDGARQSGEGYLDQMSPGAAAQLRVELLALRTAVT